MEVARMRTLMLALAAMVLAASPALAADARQQERDKKMTMTLPRA